MYLPYLRGKQFELLALRELCPLMSQHLLKISPIIEPVKNTSALVNCFKSLRSSDINFNVIVNPEVGDMVASTGDILSKIQHLLAGYENFQFAIIIGQTTDFDRLFYTFEQLDFPNPRFTYIHNEMAPNIEKIQADFGSLGPTRFNVFNFTKTSRRYPRDFEQTTRVTLEDYFSSLSKNSAYLPQNDSHFSDEYRFYKEEGYAGFGDFLTIGDVYIDSGRLPWAVAIHISYLDFSTGNVRIKHFVSDTNDDQTDVAGKFSEANSKLVAWCDAKNIHTVAVNKFRELLRKDHFPGLGTVKKLSIMNHIELMLGLI